MISVRPIISFFLLVFVRDEFYGNGRSSYFAPSIVQAFSPIPTTTRRGTSIAPLSASSFSVPAADLDANLSEEEKNVVAVVRQSGQSVAFVTTVLPVPRPNSRNNNNNNNKQPRGRSLGAGSGFVVDSRGYIVTNYHVVEQAHRMQEIMSKQKERRQSWMLQRRMREVASPQVYVRINGAEYLPCEFVDVRPELDVAVLKVVPEDATSPSSFVPLQFGDSTQLLVGQSLIAIGNPFGLDQTVTTGVVSALQRDVAVSPTAPRLRNCIQTDCSINPGNSGGPLLNRQGKVVGVNTAIVSTSGSSAGIGFAIPSAEVEWVVKDMIRNDNQSTSAWLGVSILKQQQQPSSQTSTSGCVVAKVTPDSPAAKAAIRSLVVNKTNGQVQYGDAIVAVAGNEVFSYRELQEQMERTRTNEKLALTVQDVATQERRVVYVTMETKR